MTKVILDEALRSKLNNLVDETELCDESGKTLGYCLPGDVFLRMISDWANTHTSDEELERAKKQPGGRALAEIWARLGQS